MVVATCRHCKRKHLIADNQGKLDMAEYGKKIEEYLAAQGENVQKLSFTAEQLRDNYLVDQDGKLSLVSKVMQPPADANIVNIPESKKKGFG